MKTQFTKINNWLSGKKITMVLNLLAVAIIFLSFKDGAAKHGEAVTGAPFNSGQTCSKCHSGGNFGGTIKTQLIDSITNTAVTSYSPGKKYFLKIVMKKTSTATPLYAFQTTAATLANVNINSWGQPPAKTHNKLLNGHNYVEQSASLTKGTIKLPFTGPPKGTGSIVFYTAGNLVDGTGGTSGDQPVKKSLTIAEGAAPETIVAGEKIAPTIKYSVSLYSNAGVTYLNFHNGRDKEQKVQVMLSDIQGIPFYTSSFLANPGDNVWSLKTTNRRGIIIATVITEDGVKTSQRIILVN